MIIYKGMKALLLVAMLGPVEVPDGTLLFIENGSRIVMNETNSPFSHVAIIVNVDEEAWVYEADRPRVQRLRLHDYIDKIQNINAKKRRQRRIWLMRPKVPLKEDESARLIQYLDSQVGKRYSIGGYLSGRSNCKRIHCGELTANALRVAGKRICGNACCHVPRTIMQAMRGQYHEAQQIAIAPPTPHSSERRSIAQRTKSLCLDCLQCTRECWKEWSFSISCR